MNRDIVSYVDSMMDKASNMLDHFTIKLDPIELYTLLCGSREKLDAFAKAASYMKPDSYHGVLTIPVFMPDYPLRHVDLEFTVALRSTDRYPRYLMPELIAPLTPESKLYPTLMAGIELAREWRITQDLFSRFSKVLSIDQIAFVLPWLKELGRDAYAEMKADLSMFCRRHRLNSPSHSQALALLAAFKRMGDPSNASRTPALTSRINQATRLGDKLFTQYRIMKEQNVEHSDTFVAVTLSNKLLPNWYIEGIASVIHHWNETEHARKSGRILTTDWEDYSEE